MDTISSLDQLLDDLEAEGIDLLRRPVDALAALLPGSVGGGEAMERFVQILRTVGDFAMRCLRIGVDYAVGGSEFAIAAAREPER